MRIPPAEQPDTVFHCVMRCVSSDIGTNYIPWNAREKLLHASASLSASEYARDNGTDCAYPAYPSSVIFVFYPKRFYAVKQTSLRRRLSED